ncbi:hypothetical protein [Peribacillus frigoritolerans]|uniref:hypothetical protein n=1 Tax=Peribacillus frigoritolerans TaxID=450367 RepID=UPI00382C2B1A
MDGIFVWNLVGKLSALVTFNDNDLHEALDKEQTHVDGKGLAYNKECVQAEADKKGK